MRVASFGAHASCDMFKAGTGAGHRNTREGSLDPDRDGILTRRGRDPTVVLNSGGGGCNVSLLEIKALQKQVREFPLIDQSILSTLKLFNHQNVVETSPVMGGSRGLFTVHHYLTVVGVHQTK